MRRLIGTAACLFLSASAFSQTYSYPFKGEADTELQQKLEREGAQIKHVEWAKCRYKADSKGGELIIKVEPGTPQNNEIRDEFSPIEVKRLLIDNHLEPQGSVLLSK